MMTKAEFILTAFVIVVATLWGTASRQMPSSPHLGQDHWAPFSVAQLAGMRTGTEQPLIIRSISTTTRC